MKESRYLNPEEQNATNSIMEKIRDFAFEHQIEAGLLEMAAGAACIAAGVQCGAIQIGQELVALAMDKPDGIAKKIGLVGALGGGVAGGIITSIIGGVGVCGAGGAIGIPAAVICMGGAWILGSASYIGADLIQGYLHNISIDLESLLSGGAFLAVGTYLLLDGAWRSIPLDIKNKIKEKVMEGLSSVKDFTIHLAKATWKVIAATSEKLVALYEAALKILENKKVKEALIATGEGTGVVAAGIGGGVLGGNIAAGMVAVMGVKAFGSAALALGLVSAPLWPVVVGAGTGVAGGLAIVVALKKFCKKDDPGDDELFAMQIVNVK